MATEVKNKWAFTTEPFGEPTLYAARNSSASWVRTSPAGIYLKSPTQWAANLYGGIQTNDDWASVVIPVNDISVNQLNKAMWTYYMTNNESAGVNIVIWIHDPNDFSKRAEVTQLMGLVGRSSGSNKENLEIDTTELFFYGESTTGTGLTPGTNYTWRQFREDALFQHWSIYRITFDYGWIAASTLEDAWVTEIQLNDTIIPLKPDSTGTGRMAIRHYEVESGNLTATLAPLTPFRLLNMTVRVDAVPVDGELVTLTVDSGFDGTSSEHFDTVLVSENMYDGSRQSLFIPFGVGYEFPASTEIDVLATNGSTKDYGITLTYQTVFP